MYTCKKKPSLKKYMVTKHEEHQCKVCKEKLPTFMELLKHIAKQHSPDQCQERESVKEKQIKDLNEKDTEKEFVENHKDIYYQSPYWMMFY